MVPLYCHSIPVTVIGPHIFYYGFTFYYHFYYDITTLLHFYYDFASLLPLYSTITPLHTQIRRGEDTSYTHTHTHTHTHTDKAGDRHISSVFLVMCNRIVSMCIAVIGILYKGDSLAPGAPLTGTKNKLI